jgi:hypothetical protein
VGLVHWIALSLSALAGPATPGPDVVWIDLANVPTLAQEAALREAAAVLARAGVTQRWRVSRPEEGVNDGELAVVLLRKDYASRGRTIRILGACTRSPRARVWIFLDNMAWTVGVPSLDRLLRPEQASRIGRAIGRIVAHEVIHAVAPGLEHARSGLMAARLDRDDLLANRLDVDAATIRALRLALAFRRASSTPRTS